MTLIAIILAAAALVLALAAQLKIRSLQEDLRYMHRSAAGQTEQLQAAIEELKKRQAAAPKQRGSGLGAWFNQRMTIQDALDLHPGVKGVLQSMHIGGCSSCASSASETLEQAARGHGVDLDTMLERLNALMNDPANRPAAPEQKTRFAGEGLPAAEGGRVVLGNFKAG